MLWMHTRAFTRDGFPLMSSSRRLRSPLLDASHTSLMPSLYSRNGECCRWYNLHTSSPFHLPPRPLQSDHNERESQLCVMHRCLLYLTYETTRVHTSADQTRNKSLAQEEKENRVGWKRGGRESDDGKMTKSTSTTKLLLFSREAKQSDKEQRSHTCRRIEHV